MAAVSPDPRRTALKSVWITGGAAPRPPPPPTAPEGRGACSLRAAQVPPITLPVPSPGPVSPAGACCPAGAPTPWERADPAWAPRLWDAGTPGLLQAELLDAGAGGATQAGLGKANPPRAGPRGAGMPMDPPPGWGSGRGLQPGRGLGGWRRWQPTGELAGPCSEMERKRDGHSLSGTIVFMADDRFTDTGAVRGRTGPKHAAPPQKYKIIYRNNGGAENPLPCPAENGAPPGGCPLGTLAQHPVCPDPERRGGTGAQPTAGTARRLPGEH